jgi:hypothetical protein
MSVSFSYIVGEAVYVIFWDKLQADISGGRIQRKMEEIKKYGNKLCVVKG